jgi:hypothetical protein
MLQPVVTLFIDLCHFCNFFTTLEEDPEDNLEFMEKTLQVLITNGSGSRRPASY